MDEGDAAGSNPLPFQVLLRTTIWAVPAAIAVGLMVTIAANILLRPTPIPATAAVTLGLTDSVRWPFFEPVRGRLAISVDDAMQSALRDQLGDDSIEVEAAVPDALAVVLITATADTENVAVEAADLAARLVLAEAQSDQIASLNDQITGTRANAAIATDKLADAETLLDRLLAERGTLLETEVAEIRLLEDEIAVAQRERNNWQQEIFDLDATAAELVVNLESAKPQATVVNRELVTSESEQNGQRSLAIALGVGSAVLTALAASSYFSRRGALLSSDHLAAIAIDLGTPTSPISNAVGLSRWFRHRFHPDDVVGILAGDDKRWSTQFESALLAFQPLESLPTFTDISTHSDPQRLLQIDAAIVITTRGSSIPRLRRRLAWLAENGIPVEAVLFTNSKQLSATPRQLTSEHSSVTTNGAGPHHANGEKNGTAAPARVTPSRSVRDPH